MAKEGWQAGREAACGEEAAARAAGQAEESPGRGPQDSQAPLGSPRL